MKKIIYLVSMIAFSASLSLSQTVTFSPVNQLGGGTTIPFPPFNVTPRPGAGPLPANITCDGIYSLRMDSGNIGSNLAHSTSVWSNSHTIDLRSSFETKFRIRFGNVNAADGITFTMHRDPAGLAAIENGGGHLGVSNFTNGNWGKGIEPSVNVEFDIFDNDTSNNDIDEPHVAISYDGDIAHPIVAPNVIALTDSTWHDVTIKWDICKDSGLIVRLDGVLVTQLQADLINDVFGGNPAGIFFGFTSATQNSNTTHDLCFISHEILHCECEDIENPTMTLFSPLCQVGQNCMGVNFNVNQSSPSSVMIDWGDGTVTTGANNTHVYARGGSYTIRVIAQYHLLTDPMNCCIKFATKRVNFRSASVGVGIGFPTNKGGTRSGLIQKPGSAFPNPIKKGEQLTLSLSNGETGNISIHNITGNKVMDVLNSTDSKTIKLTVPLSLKTGMYLIRFENKEIEPIKFMVD